MKSFPMKDGLGGQGPTPPKPYYVHVLGGVRVRTIEPRSTVWGGGGSDKKNVTPPKPLNVVQRCANSDTGACHRASRSSLRSWGFF